MLDCFEKGKSDLLFEIVFVVEFDVCVDVFSETGEFGERGGVGGSDFGLLRFFSRIDDAVDDSDSNILPETYKIYIYNENTEINRQSV